MKVVIVDDETHITRTLLRCLHSLKQENKEVEIVAYNDPREALTGAIDADVVVTDNDMPGLTGIALARQLRANPDFHGKILLFSGRMSDDAAPLDGIDLIRAKPFNIDLLRALLRAWLGLPTPSASAAA